MSVLSLSTVVNQSGIWIGNDLFLTAIFVRRGGYAGVRILRKTGGDLFPYESEGAEVSPVPGGILATLQVNSPGFRICGNVGIQLHRIHGMKISLQFNAPEEIRIDRETVRLRRLMVASLSDKSNKEVGELLIEHILMHLPLGSPQADLAKEVVRRLSKEIRI